MIDWRGFHGDDNGTTTVEYCVVLFLIITACIAGITMVGGAGGGLWGKNLTKIQTVM